jgi:hypothetical protein
MNAADPWAEQMLAEVDRLPAYRPNGAAGRVQIGRELDTIWADDIELQLEQPGLVDGLLATTGLTVAYGDSGSGKTFSIIDVACHIATGREWRSLPVTPGPVIYVAAEAPASVERRLVAWRMYHGVERLPLLVVRSTVNLLDAGDADALVSVLSAVRDKAGPPVLVVLDTLARAMVGNENAPDDMGALVAVCARIREAFSTHVLIVHHTGKDAARGARGHSCLRAATDTELEISSADGSGCIRVTKSRDEAGSTTYGFRLAQVDLGMNAAGRAVTTCVAVAADAPDRDPSETKPRLSPSGKLALHALRVAVAAAGERPPDHPMTRNVFAAVRVETWRNYFTQTAGYGTEDRQREAERKSWNRGRENVQAAGQAKVWGEWSWPL